MHKHNMHDFCSVQLILSAISRVVILFYFIFRIDLINSNHQTTIPSMKIETREKI